MALVSSARLAMRQAVHRANPLRRALRRISNLDKSLPLTTLEYENAYSRSVSADPKIRDAFWAEAAEGIDWHKPYHRVLDVTRPPFYKWFAGGELNTCYNALDRHVENGRGEQAAVIYESPMTGTTLSLSYKEMTDLVAKFAGVLRAKGVEKGDRVVIYMPMIPEALVAMLACARLGAVHSVVFGGFASKELAVRIDDACPKVVVSASCGKEPGRVVEYKPLLDNAIELASHKPDAQIIVQRDNVMRAELVPSNGKIWVRVRVRSCICVDVRCAGDLDWHEEMARAQPADCVPVLATDPLYLLYTSGTTGQPKGVVRDNGGHAVSLTWSMKNVMDVSPGDVYWAASDIGWVVGHTYIVFAPLMAGCSTVLYEGTIRTNLH